MRGRCTSGKNGASRQKRLLTYLLTNSASSPYVARTDFHLKVVNAQQKFSTLHRKEDLKELPIEESFVYSAAMRTGGKLD